MARDKKVRLSAHCGVWRTSPLRAGYRRSVQDASRRREQRNERG